MAKCKTFIERVLLLEVIWRLERGQVTKLINKVRLKNRLFSEYWSSDLTLKISSKLVQEFRFYERSSVLRSMIMIL